MHAPRPRRRATALLSFVAALLVSLVASPPARAGLDPWFAADEGGGGARSAAYREGQRAIDEGRWSEGAEIFARVAAEKGAEADAALYWQAYALARGGQDGAARAALRALRASYPASDWLDDAGALEVELRGPGSGVAGEAAESEELKLYALNGLLQMDPQRAVPVLQRFVQGNASPRLKKQALFVLSQSGAAEARALLESIARGQASPELQEEAIGMLGVAGGRESVATLAAIFRDSRDPAVRLAVLNGFLVAGASAEVLAIARDDQDAAVRRMAIQQLGPMGAERELRDLLARETSPALRRTIVESMAVAGDVEGLAQAARTDPDPALRRTAIHGLGIAGSPAAGAMLRQLYTASADTAIRRAVIEALFIQGNAGVLLDLFKGEKSAELRREMVQKLSLMDSPEASELLMKLLDQ